MEDKTSKPADVKWSEWDAPDKLNDRHEALILYSVLSYPTSVIAEKLGYTAKHIRKLLRAPNIQEKIRAERETRFSNVLRESMDDLCGLGIETLKQLLTSTETKDSVKLEAAKFLLDHGAGKAKALVEVQGGNLMQVIQLIEKLPKSTAPTVRDHFDDIIDQVIPNKNFVIGVRK